MPDQVGISTQVAFRQPLQDAGQIVGIEPFLGPSQPLCARQEAGVNVPGLRWSGAWSQIIDISRRIFLNRSRATATSVN